MGFSTPYTSLHNYKLANKRTRVLGVEMMTSVGGGGYPSLPQRICGSGVHPQHDLLLVVYHHNAAVSCNLCTKPLAGLHAYNCAICMFNFHWECVFGSSSVQQPQVVPPQVGVVAANVQPPPPPRPPPNVQPPPLPAGRGLGSIIAGSAIGAFVSEIVKQIIRHGDEQASEE